MLGSSCRASRAVAKAQALFVCRASVFFGAQVPRGEEARLRENGERSSRSCKGTAVERTSVLVATHRPSRDDAGSGGLCGGSSHARVGRTTRCKQNARGGPPLVALLARRKRCAEPVREGASPAETTARTFPRIGPVRTNVCFLGGRRNAARQPAPPPRGGGRGKGVERVVTSSRSTRNRSSSRWVPVHRRIAEVGGTPSGSEKRATGSQRVESPSATRSA